MILQMQKYIPILYLDMEWDQYTLTECNVWGVNLIYYYNVDLIIFIVVPILMMYPSVAKVLQRVFSDHF